MNKLFTRHPGMILAPATAVLAVFVMACGLLGSGSSATPDAATAPAQSSQATKSPAATTAPAETKPKSDTPTKAASASSGGAQTGGAEAYFGDMVEQDGFTLSAIEVSDPAKVNQDYKIKSGKRIIAIHFAVGNTALEKLKVQPLNSAPLDDAGNAYPPEFTALDSEIPVIELQAGEHADGWMGYSVPANANIVAFRYTVDIEAPKYVTVKLQAAPAGHAPIKAMTQRTPPKLAKLGAKVEANGYSLLAAGLADPATPGILYKPVDGMRLVSVDVAVSNVSSADKLFVNPMYFVLVDTSGMVYTSELGGVSDQIEAVDLTQGQIQAGKVAFVVPNDVKLESIRLAPFLRLDFTLQGGLK